MARGWGRNEEDLGAEKELALEARQEASGGAKRDAKRRAQAHTIELSLARIEDQLSSTSNPVRRTALEMAREELRRRLSELSREASAPPSGGGA